MDIMTIILSILLMLMVYITLHHKAKYSRITKLLNKMPGPAAYPVFGNAWELITSPMHRYLDIYAKRNKNYGPVYRIWMGTTGEVCINSAEEAQVILSSGDCIDKSKAYATMQTWLGPSLFLAKGQRWHTLRKQISTAFSSNILDQYLDVFQQNSETFIQKLMAKVNGSEFDICPYIARLTLDIICETVAGVKADVQKESNMLYADALHDIVDIITIRHTTPWLHPDAIFCHSTIGKRYEECVTTVHQFIGKIIHDRDTTGYKLMDDQCELYNSEVRRKEMDLLGLLRSKLSEQDQRETVNGMVFAGHDTTYSALSWAIQLLGDHLDVQEKVYEELESIFQNSDRPPLKQDLQKMKYLEQVIKETLRLYPSAPAIGREAQKDIYVGQYIIPAGVDIWIQIYFIHRNSKYYPNPDEFNPDNFLPERVCDRHPYSFLPFSAGPRNCLGQKYSILEMKVVLSYLIRNFKIKSVRRTKEMTPIPCMTLTVHEGVEIKLTPRRTNTIVNF